MYRVTVATTDHNSFRGGAMMINSRYRRSVLGFAVGMLLLGASSASAVNDSFERSCDPLCLSKPPKENMYVKAVGDLDGNGASPEISGTLAKGNKKTMVKVDLTYEWFSLNNQFRPLTVRLNDRYPAGQFLILNHLTSCGPGSCVVGATYLFDVDLQEATYPGQFYGLPLKVDLEQSSKAADANSNYNATLAIEVLKKK
jgi:hypothetical protein